ncbi:unnamed protein product [Polarella glacialis]|uniref:Uncharacterized protein n=1 Tax=Polarella glacialis TaxID=89957 RepID=A0A813JEK9_POLGL|nr:unnamed protein product [Polarella glacialis]
MRKTMEELAEIIRNPTTKLQEWDQCISHNQMCRRLHGQKLTQGILQVLIAGSPCTDYSKWGKVLQSAGPTTAFFLILMKSVLQSLPDVFVHENVTTFPMDHIVSFLGELYDITFSQIDPADDCGFPIHRKRVYLVAHRRAVVMRRYKDIGFPEYVRQVQIKSTHKLQVFLSAMTAGITTVTGSKMKRLLRYRELFSNHNVFDLNQSPDASNTAHCRMAGNSMHAAAVGRAIAYLLFFLKGLDDLWHFLLKGLDDLWHFLLTCVELMSVRVLIGTFAQAYALFFGQIEHKRPDGSWGEEHGTVRGEKIQIWGMSGQLQEGGIYWSDQDCLWTFEEAPLPEQTRPQSSAPPARSEWREEQRGGSSSSSTSHDLRGSWPAGAEASKWDSRGDGKNDDESSPWDNLGESLDSQKKETERSPKWDTSSKETKSLGAEAEDPLWSHDPWAREGSQRPRPPERKAPTGQAPWKQDQQHFPVGGRLPVNRFEQAGLTVRSQMVTRPGTATSQQAPDPRNTW